MLLIEKFNKKDNQIIIDCKCSEEHVDLLIGILEYHFGSVLSDDNQVLRKFLIRDTVQTLTIQNNK